MIIKTVVKVEIGNEEREVPYEGVLEGEFEPTADVQQFVIVVHDPDKFGGRRKAFFCDRNAVPIDHVVLATIAIKK